MAAVLTGHGSRGHAAAHHGKADCGIGAVQGMGALQAQPDDEPQQDGDERRPRAGYQGRSPVPDARDDRPHDGGEESADRHHGALGPLPYHAGGHGKRQKHHRQRRQRQRHRGPQHHAAKDALYIELFIFGHKKNPP